MRTFDYEHGGHLFLSKTAEELLSKGVPQSAVDALVFAARQDELRGECRLRIYSVASAEAQMNIANSVAIIACKPASVRSAQDEATLAGAIAMSEWIAAMRAACAELAQDGETDFSADAAWPEVPEDVVTLVARF